MKLHLTKIKHKKRRFFWFSLVAVVFFLLGSGLKYHGSRTIYIPPAKRWSYFSETCNVVEYRDGRMRLYNNETKKYTTPKLDWIAWAHPGDTMMVFSIKGKRGYLNPLSGEIRIQPVYKHAWQFSEGLAAVEVGGKIGFIDTKGQTRIPFKFTGLRYNATKFGFRFKSGYCIMVNSNGKLGLIDRKGCWALKPVYEDIQNPVLGLRIARQKGKFGILDGQLRQILPFEFDSLDVMKQGIKAAKDGTQQLLSLDAKKILKSFVFDSIRILGYETDKYNSQGDAILANTGFYTYKIARNWGLMDPNGKPITKAIYESIEAASSRLFICNLETAVVTVDVRGVELKRTAK